MQFSEDTRIHTDRIVHPETRMHLYTNKSTRTRYETSRDDQRQLEVRGEWSRVRCYVTGSKRIKPTWLCRRLWDALSNMHSSFCSRWHYTCLSSLNWACQSQMRKPTKTLKKTFCFCSWQADMLTARLVLGGFEFIVITMWF